ncbi:MAG TPA: DUF4147 domain-containing protein [Kofleriaceae bacterium]|nr:DUF4147 domain-containing protein [Kofleriaceae bacterium]
MSARDRLEGAFRAAVASLEPAPMTEAAVRTALPAGTVRVVAMGKAAAGMARGAARALGPRLLGGLVVVPEAAEVPAPLQMLVAAHPVPTQQSERAGLALLDEAARGGADHLLALISGGASALAVAPAAGLGFDAKVQAVHAVMDAGASIADINTVRKHLSAIKGGRLAEAAAMPVTALISSDVVGDDPAVIGSGLTVPDPSTFADALAVIARHGAPVPPGVIAHLEAGARGERSETPKRARPGDRASVIAGTRALAAAAAEALGADARIVATDLTADVDAVADRVQAWLAEAPPGQILIAAGEPTVRLPALPGCGGRAHQLALLIAWDIAGTQTTVLVAGSDGIDGSTQAAGAIVDGGTIERLRIAGIDADEALARADAGTALAAIGATVVTGRTGVNHADLVLAVVQRGGV